MGKLAALDVEQVEEVDDFMSIVGKLSSGQSDDLIAFFLG
jgi:hypothetical protein